MDTNSLFSVSIGELILYFVAFIFSLSVHESAHALTSYWFGDDTARLQGRISLNPMAHIDPIGTLLIPLLGFLRGGISLIGWAKPVDVNPLRWRRKDLANITVSAAGPISNLMLALVVFIALKIMLVSGVMTFPGDTAGRFDLVAPVLAESGDPGLLAPVATLLSIMLLLNVSLAVFNLIPIPPLDGSHVVETLLPASLAEPYAQLSRYSYILLLGLMYIGVFSAIQRPIVNFVVWALYLG